MRIPRKLRGSVTPIVCEHISSGVLESFCGVMSLAQSFEVAFNKNKQLEGTSKKKDLKTQPSGTKKHLKNGYRTTTMLCQMRHTGWGAYILLSTENYAQCELNAYFVIITKKNQ